MSALGAWWRDPWRKPRVLAAVTVAYLLWSLLPVLVAVLFSFNSGRSRTSWQGFSMRWYYGDPFRSVWHDDTLQAALVQTLKLGLLVTLVTVPLGVALAIGLDRWHGRLPQRCQRAAAAVLRAPRDPAGGRAALRGDDAGAAGDSRDERPGGRPGDLPAGLPGDPGARPAGDDRLRPRGGGDGPRRLAARGAAPGDPADAGAGDRGQRRAGLRRRDRRLRHRPLPLGRLRDRADVGEDLQHRARRPDPRAQRPRHA